MNCLTSSYSIQTDTNQLLHCSTDYNASPLSQTMASMWRPHPCFSLPHFPDAVPVLLTLILFSFPSFILPSFAWICIFLSSEQGLLPALSNKCISDVSVERDILHIHLLLCHLVLLKIEIFKLS